MSTFLPTVDSLPSDLTKLRAWLTWSYVQKPGDEKPRKMPYYASGKIRKGQQGSPADRAALVTFEDACAAAQKHGRTGVGLAMLPEHGVVALDFDGCVTDGIVNNRVTELIAGTYAEISPSGRGVRAFMRGSQFKNHKDGANDRWPFGFEVFQSNGFVTVTGNSFGVDDLLGPYVSEVSGPVLEHYNARFSAPQIAAPLTTGEAPIGATIEQLREVLKHHSPGLMEPKWWSVLSVIHHETGGSAEGLALADEWSSPSEKYKGRMDVEAKWRSLDGRTVENPKTIASLRVEIPATVEDFEVVSAEESANVADVRPLVRLRPGKLDEYAEKCQAILCSDIYVQSNALVRLGGADELKESSTSRDATQAVVVPATVEYLRGRLTKKARIEKYDARTKQWLRVDCPKYVAEHIAYQRDWPTLRQLVAIARAPFVRADGSICETPGYDAQSRVIYSPNAEFPPIPVNPSKDDAQRALALLIEPFNEFPFATDAAGSAFVACILTEAVRVAIDTSPAFFFTAPSPGTGKTLLSGMPALLVHGHVPATRPWAEREDELRKSLFSGLLTGDRTIRFDNLQDGAKIRSPMLCGFLTTPIYSDRKLGVSESPSLINHSVVSASGNNITPTSDLARRSIVIRLDANTARLKERTFKLGDLRGFVSANRPSLLIAALTIIRAHLLAAIRGKTPLPSFEQWSRLVRDALIWMGMVDPVATQLTETEDETAPLAEAFELIAAWCNRRGGKQVFSASDLAEASDFPNDDDALSKSLEAAGCGDPHDKQRVGYWLRGNKDRIAGDFKLQRMSETNGTPKWRMQHIGAPVTEDKDELLL